MKKILIVDDDPAPYHQLKKKIQDRGFEITVLRAQTCAEGRRIFEENRDLDLIVMDGFLVQETTIDLVMEIRPQFTGIILANSSSAGMQTILQDAGCDHQTFSKNHFWREAFFLLDLMSEEEFRATQPIGRFD